MTKKVGLLGADLPSRRIDTVAEHLCRLAPGRVTMGPALVQSQLVLRHTPESAFSVNTPAKRMLPTRRWTGHVVRHLVRQGFKVSDDTVGRLLKKLGYSLQSPAKVKEGTAPDRDGQFRYPHGQAQEFVAAGEPVISVDTKKNELIKEFDNGGLEWQPEGEPTRVNVHDFVDPELGRAIPYGIYDETNNEGWVSVSNVADTSEFAVNSIRVWWHQRGASRFPAATRLLITADAGGSNGHRVRAWKTELARLATETGLDITVCHYPPGTSTWNRIEHRMSSFTP